MNGSGIGGISISENDCRQYLQGGKEMKILWCGPFFSDAALQEKKAPNQAAAKWSRGFLRGLEAAGVEIRVIDHCSEQRWPRGRVFWQGNSPRWFLDWFPCERVSYCNAWGVKDTWLAWAYARAARRIFSTWRPDIVLCYNSLHSFNVACMREASKVGVRSVPIILDGDDPRQDNWTKLVRDNRFASGIVFLSWWMYQNYPNHNLPLFHMDGGADGFKGILSETSLPVPPRSTCTYTLVHTGALDKWRGLDFMRGVVRACRRSDVRFVFCGKCDKATMWAEFGNDPRVEVKGFVSNEEVDKISRKADAFLNVRTPGLGDNLVNYPSKVPQYLAWGKPVVSTWNDSFSPDYRDILEVCDDTPEGFVRVLEDVLAWDEEKRRAKFNQIKVWFDERKSWTRQSSRLLDFIGTLP